MNVSWNEAKKEITSPADQPDDTKIQFEPYGDQPDSPWLESIRELISKDLSEPYSIYVYRYFLYQWPDLCFMATNKKDGLIGVIVCKLEPHRGGPLRGYIAMLATKKDYRGQRIASRLVTMAVDKMKDKGADEIALETECDNIPSLKIYERLGFLRTKRLYRYYLSGTSAFRLVLYLKPGIPWMKLQPPAYPFDDLQNGVVSNQNSSQQTTDPALLDE